MIKDDLAGHAAVLERVAATLVPTLERAAATLAACLHAGGKILLFGNGGSAADAQHIAAELTGRHVVERRALPAIALTCDGAALTAIANDYGYDQVFVRQLQALARPGDVAVALSTSGLSPSVLRGLAEARKLGCRTIGLTGRNGGSMPPLCDETIVVPSDETARIQEMHILIGHALCRDVESMFVRK